MALPVSLFYRHARRAQRNIMFVGDIGHEMVPVKRRDSIEIYNPQKAVQVIGHCPSLLMMLDQALFFLET